MSERVTVIVAGCAECSAGDSEPLVEAKAFDSVESAKDWALSERWVSSRLDPSTPPTVHWKPHPQGGEYVNVSQGSLWILQETPKPEDGNPHRV